MHLDWMWEESRIVELYNSSYKPETLGFPFEEYITSVQLLGH